MCPDGDDCSYHFEGNRFIRRELRRNDGEQEYAVQCVEYHGDKEVVHDF